jgi:hypothetical protein
VDVNLTSITDAAFVESARMEAERLAAEADSGIRAACARLTA